MKNKIETIVIHVAVFGLMANLLWLGANLFLLTLS